MNLPHKPSKVQNQCNHQDECVTTLLMEDFNDNSPAFKEAFSMNLATSPLIKRIKNEDSKLNIIEEFFFKKIDYSYLENNDRSQKSFEMTKTKNCPCEVVECGKNFLNCSRLQIHQRSHQEINQFKCLVCEKEFSEKGNLKTHSRVHTGDRPFTCSFKGCVKKFKTKGHLSDHNRTHYNVKEFCCEICKKSFRLRNSWKVHIKTHSGDKPFVCTIVGCVKAFSKKGNLKIHLNSHYKKTGALSLCTEATIYSSIFSERNHRDAHRVREKEGGKELNEDFVLSAAEFVESP